MKEILARAVTAALLVTLMGNDLSAQTVPPVKPAPSKFFATRVQGRLTLHSPTSGALAGFRCSNISVDAISRELKPHAPKEFGGPKWVRTTNATPGCDYSIPVPANSSFYLTAHGHGEFDCTSIVVSFTPNAAAIGPISVPYAETRTLNATVMQIRCEVLH